MISNFGLLRLLDANQSFAAAGLPAYLRTKNFTDNSLVTDLGFQFVPSTSGALVGTSDTLIIPPPTIKLVSMHSLAMAQAAGVELRAGARKVTISHSWVAAQQATLGYSTPQQVFNAGNVVGIVSDNLLMEIVNLTHSDAGGQILAWHLLCNTSEISGA